ncbi:MAG: TauD/TfdA family dioxygenase, partial [Roseomonas sp.]|nr:TauD/TfdA family dioxygenase [Roseomonas sp.]
MSVTITPANPARPDFVGVVAGIDLKNPVSAADAVAIDAGMDKFGVLVFHGQDINDE